MGVDSAWPYLANVEGVEYPEVVPKDSFTRVHLDMPAIYFALARSIHCHKTFAEMKRHMNSPANVDMPYILPSGISRFLDSIDVSPISKRDAKAVKLETDAIKSSAEFLSLIGSESTLPTTPATIFEVDISAAIDTTLLRKFSKDQGILHFDGPKTIQKTYAHEKREKSRIGAIAAFVHKASSVLSHIANLQSQVNLITAAGNPKPTKNQILRVVKIIRGPLLKAWINTKAMSHKDWRALGGQLSSKGWTVHACSGEADVCIARHAEEEQEDTVVASGDSDNVFHGAAYVLRKSPRGGQFFSYDIGAVLGTLGISYQQWQAIAVLSENDYDPKLPGQSFATIVETIRGMPEKLSSNSYVDEYCSTRSVDRTLFKNSVKVFIENKEDRAAGGVSENNGSKLVDHLMMHVVNEISKLRQR